VSSRPESLLAALPAELSQSLFAKARPLSLKAEQSLLVAGDEGDGFYRVEEGATQRDHRGAGRGERILAILGPGSIVGELSMIDRGPRSDWCAEPSRDYEEFVGAKKHRDPSRGFMALGP
jgi:CRP/FNR family transcriptional regulator, cyclic AMP receptor protein